MVAKGEGFEVKKKSNLASTEAKCCWRHSWCCREGLV